VTKLKETAPMSRFPWGIRPPGAPTSIRPPSTPSTDGPLSS